MPDAPCYYLQLADDAVVHRETLRDVEHHDDGEGAEQQLAGQVHVVDRVAADRDRPLLDRGDVGVPGVGEDDGGVGSVHDDLQVYIPFPEHRGVMLGRDLHGHEHRNTSRSLNRDS